MRRGATRLLRQLARAAGQQQQHQPLAENPPPARGAASLIDAALGTSATITSTSRCGPSARSFHSFSIRDDQRFDGTRARFGSGVGAIARIGGGARSYSFTMPSPTSLDAVMRTEHLADRTADEIEEIWMAFHGEGQQQEGSDAGAAEAAASSSSSPATPPPAGEHCVGTVLSAEEYKVLSARAKASPMFVLPLRKTVRRRAKNDGGDNDTTAAAAAADPTSSPPAYLTLLLQWQLPLLLVTTVDEYRRLGPGAPPHLVATFYPQLADSKGIVLARGDLTGGGAGKAAVGSGGAVTSRAEARTVLELARAFYTDSDMHQLAYRFNHDQQGFDFAELLRALGLEGAEAVAG
jgi:ATP synthase F1 complex assembly factor 1/histone-lysine N-methyltransferase SETD2